MAELTSTTATTAGGLSTETTTTTTNNNDTTTTTTTITGMNARLCSSPNCNKPASLRCPTCISLNLADSYFCGQQCFQQNWPIHNKVHIRHREKLERIEGLKNFKVPEFAYTGSLRPSYITPRKTVPDSIEKPDYAVSGFPHSENRFSRTYPNKIPIYTAQDIEGVRLACRLGREVLDIAGRMVRPGITTDEIDAIVHEACIERGCYPSPLNYNGFLKSCCTSVNEVVCHGIPDCRPLEDGDIVNIDISVYKDGYHGDLNETYTVGNVEQKYKDLIKASHDSLMKAIAHVKPDVMFRKLGEVIDAHVSKYGFSANRTYCGHGIGKLFHCTPNIPHYKKNKAVGKAKPGMIFTIEPMINAGHWKDKIWTFDEWTDVTLDGERSAQFEHTLLVTEDGCEILTARTPQSPPLWWEIEPSSNTNPEEKKSTTEENDSTKANTEAETTQKDNNESDTHGSNDNNNTKKGNRSTQDKGQKSKRGRGRGRRR